MLHAKSIQAIPHLATLLTGTHWVLFYSPKHMQGDACCLTAPLHHISTIRSVKFLHHRIFFWTSCFKTRFFFFFFKWGLPSSKDWSKGFQSLIRTTSPVVLWRSFTRTDKTYSGMDFVNNHLCCCVHVCVCCVLVCMFVYVCMYVRVCVLGELHHHINKPTQHTLCMALMVIDEYKIKN